MFSNSSGILKQSSQMKFLAEDNNSFNDKKHILALGRDSPITAY